MRLVKPNTLLLLLIIVLPLAIISGLMIGPVIISLNQMAGTLYSTLYTDSVTNQQQSLILYDIRLPRVLLGALVGAVLASCGAVLQGLFRNPLADPTLIGVSSGASAGASFAIVMGAQLLDGGLAVSLQSDTLSGLPIVALGAFIGGLIAALIVYRLASGPEGTSVATMLLAGIAISALAGAINSLLSFFADNEMLRRISLWQMGNLDSASWNQVIFISVTLAILILWLPRESRALNAMLLGESEARYLGVEVEWMKRRLIILTALGVGVSVAVAGMVAFVGLIVPHLVRLLIGPDHRYLIPGSALSGALLLILADSLAKVVVAPAELPTGVITALLGAPFFVSLLIQQRIFQQQGRM